MSHTTMGGASIAAVLVAVISSACTPTPTPPVVGEPVVNEVVRAGDFGRGAVGMPEGEVVASLSDLAEIHRGAQKMTERCMNQRGFDYVALALGEDQQWEPLAIGPADPDVLRRHGYTVLPSTARGGQRNPMASPDAEVDPNARITSGMRRGESRRWIEALYGEPGGPKVTILPQGMAMGLDGCYVQGLEAVFGSAGALLNIDEGGMAVMYRAWDLLHADPAFLAAYESWGACMGERGRTVEPIDHRARRYLDGARLYGAGLVTDAYATMPERAPTEELLIAEDDADCQQRTGLDRVTVDTRERIIRQVATDMNYDLQGRQELIAYAVQRARQVNSGQAPSR